MERDLRTLRRSKLMNYSEFRVMTTALERYYKDVKIAIMTGKRTPKDLDMRPYLYDEGDPYDKPFYGTLLKMLSEVVTSKYFDKQHEDLLKIYKWFKANRKLIASPPKVPIPSSQKNNRNSGSDGGESMEEDDEDEEEVEEVWKELAKIPKLHFRPKTAPAVESRKGVRYVTWNEAQQQEGPRRASSASKERNSRKKDPLTVSLRISPYGAQSQSPDGHFTERDGVTSGYLLRPGTAPALYRNAKGRVNAADLKSFILRPTKSSPAPVSSPVTSPLSSPRDSPIPTNRAKSPISAHFTPEAVKEPSVKLSVKPSKDKVSHQSTVGGEANVTSFSNTSSGENQAEGEDKENGENTGSKQHTVPKGATPTELEELLKQQKTEEQLLEEQHELLQKKLLHDYDRYVEDVGSQGKQVDLEIVNGHVGITNVAQDSRQTVSASPVGTYDLSAPEIVPSYSRVYSERFGGAHAGSQSESGIQRSSTNHARHHRYATVPQNNPQEVIKVDAVLGMVTSIGHQMEYDRERMIGQKLPIGQRKPAIIIPTIPIRNAQTESFIPKPLTVERGSVPDSPRLESTGDSHQTTGEQDTPLQEDHTSGPLSDSSDNRSIELKLKEPELSPERTPRDYSVHFPQDKSQETTPPRNFKTSGPVVPDTIRYQWTDDGFGNRTYLKKLKSPTSPRGTRKKRQTTQVTMPTGSRSLDKRTLASLVVVKQLGEADRRNIDRIGGTQNGSLQDQDGVDYSYHLEYLNFCQPVGPRLGECENPSSVNWYLQGEHGLYREPTRSTIESSDDFRHHRSDVRIPKDRYLMVEGHHFGEEEHKKDEHPSWATELSSSSIVSLESGQTSKDSPRTSSPVRPSSPSSHSLRALSPARPSSATTRILRPSSPSRTSASSTRKVIPIPTAGRSSRPSSAHSSCEKHHNFTVRDFKHFCWPDEYLLNEDYIRQREVWAAVNIQRIFRGFMARQYLKELRQAQSERERKAAVTLQSNFRGFLARKRAMDLNLRAYTPSSRSVEWARQYKQDLKRRDEARKHKNQYVLFKQNRDAEKQEQQLKQVKATQHIYDVFHPLPEGPTKAQMKAAAITIQRYFRGWFVRRMFKKSKAKALKRTLSFNKFVKGYQDLLYRIQKRYGVKNPTTELEFHELMEYVERLNKYEVAFDKFATNGILRYTDIKEFFKTLDLVPTQKEIDEAIELVTKRSPKGRDLTKAEVVEILFQIYVPKGTKLNLADVRKSTWLNPLDDGRDIMQLLSKKDLEQTNLLKCLEVVAGAGKESEDIQNLLRPGSAKKAEPRKQDGKKKTSSKQPRKSTVLAQYPMRPSTPKYPRPPSGKRPNKK